MTKYILTISLVTHLSFSSLAQRSVEEKLYSAYTVDTLNYTVWLPENWSKEKKYTTIYTFSYGASDAEFIAEQIKYLNKKRIVNMPATMVVNIHVDMDRIGYNYETGTLTEKGLNMVKCIGKELVPLIEHKYKASKFRTYMGQSYGASYGNYLFLYQPELFSGYILMSPESLAPAQPPFKITPNLAKFYSDRPTYYFLASGGLDLDRRKKYTEEIAGTLKQLDSTKFNFHYYNFNEAGHNNSTAIGLPIALDFIYREFNSQVEAQNEKSILSAIKQQQKKVIDIYGVSPERNSFSVYQPFLQNIWQRNDTTGMLDANNYFITGESGGRQLRDFAYSCSIVGLREKSRMLYEKAITKILKDEMSTNYGPSTLITCYRELAAELAKSNPQKGWELLQSGLEVALKYKRSIYIDYYPDIYFYLGKFTAENDYKVSEGLKYLLIYAEERKNLVDIIHFNPDQVSYNIAKCYVSLKDIKKAKLYLQMSINFNPTNNQAKELFQKLNLEN